jgi:molybdopterin-binding protein
VADPAPLRIDGLSGAELDDGRTANTVLTLSSDRICGYASPVTAIRVREAAELLGVSDDSIRRWIDDGSLPADLDRSGRKVIAGDVLAEFARAHATTPPKDPLSVGSSARNRFAGLVTKVVADGVMAQVEMQCGPFTVVSLMSSDAARELNLKPGSVAVAVVKATTVIVETPKGQS